MLNICYPHLFIYIYTLFIHIIHIYILHITYIHTIHIYLHYTLYTLYIITLYIYIFIHIFIHLLSTITIFQNMAVGEIQFFAFNTKYGQTMDHALINGNNAPDTLAGFAAKLSIGDFNPYYEKIIDGKNLENNGERLINVLLFLLQQFWISRAPQRRLMWTQYL